MLTGGFYAEVTLGYDPTIAVEKGGRPFGVEGLRAIQPVFRVIQCQCSADREPEAAGSAWPGVVQRMLPRRTSRRSDRHHAVRAEVSRLVVDVERFQHDKRESMARRGMGAVYSVTSGLELLRRALTPAERQGLIERFYLPHHAALTLAVDRALAIHGRCLVIDCHSFPGLALPYEQVRDAGGIAPQSGADGCRAVRQDADKPSNRRPDICIGTDPFHTPDALRNAFVGSFARAGWTVSVDSPFAGALVPIDHFETDLRVAAVMVEVNRALYLDEC